MRQSDLEFRAVSPRAVQRAMLQMPGAEAGRPVRQLSELLRQEVPRAHSRQCIYRQGIYRIILEVKVAGFGDTDCGRLKNKNMLKIAQVFKLI